MYYCIAEFKEIEPHQKQLSVFKDISEELFNLLSEKEKTLTHFLFSNNYYKMLLTNIDELLNYILEIENKENKNIFETEKRILNVNRLTINLLGIFFSYINHYENDLKDFTGKNSEQVKKFKCITSKYFDNYFEYRFLYKLRNYSVHCSIPITTISSSIENPLKQYYINTKSLLDNFSQWGTIVKSDLEKIDKINIKDLVEKSKAIFYELHKELVLINDFDIYTNINIIESYRPKEINSPIILVSNTIEDFGNMKIKIFDPFRTVERAKYEIHKLGISSSFIYTKDKGTAIFGNPFI